MALCDDALIEILSWLNYQDSLNFVCVFPHLRPFASLVQKLFKTLYPLADMELYQPELALYVLNQLPKELMSNPHIKLCEAIKNNNLLDFLKYYNNDANYLDLCKQHKRYEMISYMLRDISPDSANNIKDQIYLLDIFERDDVDTFQVYYYYLAPT